jgi:hypothetical protein
VRHQDRREGERENDPGVKCVVYYCTHHTPAHSLKQRQKARRALEARLTDVRVHVRMLEDAISTLDEFFSKVSDDETPGPWVKGSCECVTPELVLLTTPLFAGGRCLSLIWRPHSRSDWPVIYIYLEGLKYIKARNTKGRSFCVKVAMDFHVSRSLTWTKE